MIKVNFLSNVNDELSNDEFTVIDITDMGGEFSGLAEEIENCEGIKVIDNKTIQITMPVAMYGKWPSARKILYFILRAIRSIFCKECG